MSGVPSTLLQVATDLGYRDEADPNATSECEELQEESTALAAAAAESMEFLTSHLLVPWNTKNSTLVSYSEEVDEQDVQEEVRYNL